MKSLFGNKIFIIGLIFVLLAGAGGAYFFIYKKDGATSQDASRKTEVKVDSLFGYIGSESNYSKFNTLVGMFDSSKYLTKNEAGLEPSLMVFAPNNEAFSKDDMKPFDSLNALSREKVRLYHMAKIYPLSQGVAASLELADGQKIVTLSGKDLLVKKTDASITIIDGKGRDAIVSQKYAVSAKGDRIYFINNVLLFQ